MSWGSGSNSGWGNSGFGASSSGGNTDPEGAHNPSCIAGSGWGKNGPMSSYYDSSCSGCKRDRAMNPWGSTTRSTGVFKLLAVVGAVSLGKKSLWED